AMITTIGVSYILFNIILLSQGAAALNYPNPMPKISWKIAGADLHLREVLVWLIALLLMIGLNFFVRRTRMGKAMQATAQDQEAARMMGIEVDSVVMLTFFLGSALAGAAGLIFGLYYNFTSYVIGYTSGLRAFTAAVLGGIGSIPGAMLGGILIGLIESLGGQLIATRWTDVIIFSILILVLVFRPTGLLGRLVPPQSSMTESLPQKSSGLGAVVRAQWRRIPAERRRTSIAIAVAVFLLVFPLIDRNGGDVDAAANATAFAVLALGLNIVVSFAGLLDLGY